MPMEPYEIIINPDMDLRIDPSIGAPKETPIIFRVEDGEKIGYFHFYFKNGKVSEIWEMQY